MLKSIAAPKSISKIPEIILIILIFDFIKLKASLILSKIMAETIKGIPSPREYTTSSINPSGMVEELAAKARIEAKK